WAPRGELENVTEARAREAEWIARRLAAMIDREALVVADREGTPTLRPVRPGDVVLLFRAMSNVHLYEAALRDCGLNYYLVGGRAGAAVPRSVARPQGPAADRPAARRGIRRLRLRRGHAVRVPRRPQAGQPVEAARPGADVRPLGAVRPGGVYSAARRPGAHA